MKPELWFRVRELFERALDQPPADAAAWVRSEAGGDAAVAEEVLSLLRSHGAAGAFLDEPATARTGILTEDAPFEPGHVLGPYTIVREAGRGGMGRVYVATDDRLGRTVALKAIRPQIGNEEEQRARLRREARAAASLSHPGICTVYALEEFDGDLFVISEFVEGRTLREEMTDGARPSGRDVLQTAREIAAALACAHEAGITHRDLKPENVMRTRDGRLKILDFGLARVANPAPSSEGLTAHDTRPGSAWGTPGYMAPEQLNGDTADARSDVFVFGVLMYEYACGVHPFDAPTPLALAARVLESAPQAVAALRVDLPTAVGVAIERCLRKSPAERFASATDLMRELERGRPTHAPGIVAWWRLHQVIVIASYLAASGIGWQVKQSAGGGTTLAAFLAIGIASTVGSVFRAHLLFTERVNRPRLDAERRRTAPVTIVIDSAIALILAFDGRSFMPRAPLAAVLTVALGIVLVLARLVLEPSTTTAAFGDR